MQKRFFFVLTLTFALLMTGSAFAQETASPCPGQEKASPCPGKEKAGSCAGQKTSSCCKDKDWKPVSLDYQGKKFYFCCDASMEAFKKEPEKHVKKLLAKGLTFDPSFKPQETCPVTGGKINRAHKLEYEGIHIYACCPGCFEKFNADPAKYVKVMQERGESPILCIGGCGGGQMADGKSCSKSCSKSCGKEKAKTCPGTGKKEAVPTS